MRVQVIDCIEQLEAVAAEWDSVLSSSSADTVFLTSDWLISWWEGFQPQGRIMCLAVRGPDGFALGFAPFYTRQKIRMGLSYQALLFLGDGTNDSEYMDIFCVKGHEDEVFPLVLDWLSAHQDQWDVCEWNIIPEDSLSLKFIKKWSLQNKFSYTGDIYECSHILLPASYEEYLDSLNKKHGKNVRYYGSRARKKSNVEYLAFDDHEILPQGLDILYDLHKKRWNSVGLAGSFADQGRKKFYERMTRRFSKKGWLRLRQLNLFGRPAAIQIGFVYNNVYSALQEGFDPELGKECPGVVLRSMHIQELIEEGVKVYDFLGYPSSAKERWNTRLHYCRSLTIPKNKVRAWTIVKVPGFLKRIKKRLRAIASG